MIYWLLFWEFLKTGLFAIGGGLATRPFLMDISARHPEWYSMEDLSNMIAVSESTPGPIGINMATYVGFTTAGVLGSVLATIGIVLPSLIIIMIIAGFLSKFRENKLVQNTFYSLRPAVIGMLGVSLASMIIPLFLDFGAVAFLDTVNLKAIALFAVMLFGILKFKKHPIVYIAIGAIVGIILKF